MTNKFLSLIGLAHRAGKLVGGEEKVLQAIQKSHAHLVIVAQDASHNTSKKFTDKCKFYRIPINRDYGRAELGAALGKAERVVLAVTDKGFADAMLKERQDLK